MYKELDYWFQYQDKRIYSLCTMPIDDKEKYPTVIFVHGYAGDYTDNLVCSRMLSESGFIGFNLDLIAGSSHSKSEGLITETSIMKQLDQLMEVIKQVKEMDRVDNDNIFLYGESQGGLICSLACEKLKEEIKGLVLLYPAFTIPQMVREMYESKEAIQEEQLFLDAPVGRCYLEDIWSLNPYDVVGNYLNPVCLLHGSADSLVPIESSFKINKIYQKIEFYVIENANHGFYNQDLIKANMIISDFLLRMVSKYEKTK